MRGSRMRDRRPPSHLWNCGTRAARLSRQRAILMASTLPSSLFSGPLSGFTCGSASTIRAPNHCAGPSRPTFCHQLRLHRAPGSSSWCQYFRCPAEPFLTMRETLAPAATDVYCGDYRFSPSCWTRSHGGTFRQRSPYAELRTSTAIRGRMPEQPVIARLRSCGDVRLGCC